MRQQEKSRKAKSNSDSSASLARDKYGLEIALPWDTDALEAIAKAPRFVRKMAVGNVEDYAEEQGLDRVTLEVVRKQAESAGMGKFMSDAAGARGGILKRLFGKR